MDSYPEFVKQTERHEDMSANGKLKMFRQDGGDVVLVAINDEGRQIGLEFCTSGGKSPNTHRALCALMVAMEKDNAVDK